MNVAILVFDGFNELDAFVPAALLNGLAAEGLSAAIAAPAPEATSQGGVRIAAQHRLDFANAAEAVLIAGGARAEAIASDPAVLGALSLDPARQIIVSQGSGAHLLAALGLVAPGRPICTDLASAPAIRALGFTTPGKPFHAEGDVASAGGALASQYAAAWIAARLLGVNAMERMVWDAAPVGEKDAWLARTLSAVDPFLRFAEAA